MRVGGDGESERAVVEKGARAVMEARKEVERAGVEQRWCRKMRPTFRPSLAPRRRPFAFSLVRLPSPLAWFCVDVHASSIVVFSGHFQIAKFPVWRRFGR